MIIRGCVRANVRSPRGHYILFCWLIGNWVTPSSCVDDLSALHHRHLVPAHFLAPVLVVFCPREYGIKLLTRHNCSESDHLPSTCFQRGCWAFNQQGFQESDLVEKWLDCILAYLTSGLPIYNLILPAWYYVIMDLQLKNLKS